MAENRVLLVSYDLRSAEGGQYDKLFEAMKSLTWWHYLQSTWLVVTSETADSLGKRLAGLVVKGDRLLVIEVTGRSQGLLPGEAWDWINKHVPE